MIRHFPMRLAAVLAVMAFALLTPARAPASGDGQLSDQPGRRSGADFVLRNVHVIDTATGEIARDRAIIIRGDVILAIVSDGAITGADNPAMQVIDGGGAFAIPALWDAHVHIMQNGAENALAQAAQLLGHGVGHVRDMGSSLAAHDEMLALLRAPKAKAPTIVSAGPALWTFTMPYGDASQKVVLDDPATIPATIAALRASGIDFLKVYAGFDTEQLTLLAAAARTKRLAMAGHAQPGMTLEQQARIGMRTIEHLDFSTFAECVPDHESYFERVIAARFRQSGESIPAIYGAFAAAADTPECRARLRAAAAAGLVLTPTLVTTYLSPEAAEAEAAAMPPWGLENCSVYLQQFAGLDAEARADLPAAGRRLMRIVIDAGIPVLAGSDMPAFCTRAGSSLVNELAVMADAGLPPLAVLQSATLLPGRLFGQSPHSGRIAVDGPSDILLLAANPLEDAQAYARPSGLYTRRQWYDGRALTSLRGSPSNSKL
jgi:imidazolonepropionase-like amidohydrolase